MLVLNRQQGEKIIIGNNIEITIIGSRGIVQVGINAPRDIKILREELCNSKPNQIQASTNYFKASYEKQRENTYLNRSR